jgi:hypothetical protein
MRWMRVRNGPSSFEDVESLFLTRRALLFAPQILQMIRRHVQEIAQKHRVLDEKSL